MKHSLHELQVQWLLGIGQLCRHMQQRVAQLARASGALAVASGREDGEVLTVLMLTCTDAPGGLQAAP